MASPTKISSAGVSLIKSFEGYHRRLPNGDCTTYYCPARVLTIGYGCTEGITEGEVWTEAQAAKALMREIAKHEAAVMRLVTADISQQQFDALVSFSYNCGTGALARSTLLKRLNAGDYEGAARGFAAWNKGGGRVLPGLVRRRAQEAALFLQAGPVEPPSMPQLVDDPETSQPTGSRKEATSKTGMGLAALFWALCAAVKLKIDGWISDPFGTIGAAHDFISAHGWETAAVAALVFFIGFKVISVLNREDYVEGRSTPSGEVP